ncbi:MAG: alpha-D-ribose 1-methylphosphonate 5-triphosphate diphosphatase [Bauldia sp.]|nr:alpha-D-ribose 1-methylphosphonate 5-triphosphate diphosphatase [Bauldia sp.]
MTETVLRNARLVLPDEVIAGDVVIRGGDIAIVDERGHGHSGFDLEGDWLIPGLVELHTDHLEGHYAPRPRVRWDPVAAVQAHDAQIATSGITTVLDALRVGLDDDTKLEPGDMQTLAGAIEDSQRRGRLRAEHFIHLRCEVSAPDVLDSFTAFVDNPRVRVASLMDHTPGQRQFTSLDAFRAYYQGKGGLSDAELDELIVKRRERAEQVADVNRQAIAGMAQARGIVLASHDDATEAHVAEAIDHGVTLAEFPTTHAAAAASHGAGLKVLMGAPNIVRGKSHSGNIAARELVDAGLLDVLSSDYFPFSLIHATFLIGLDETVGMPRAIAMVSANPAAVAGLDDRGAIAEGKRADLVHVHVHDHVPVVRAVYRQGRRVV